MADYEINHAMPSRRVVITGMGVIAPNGSDLGMFWDTVMRGASAAAPVTRFDTSEVPTKIGCEIKDFNPRQYMDYKKARRYELSTQFGIAASIMAVKDAGINFREMNPDRVGVVEGTSLSATETALKSHTTLLSKGYTQMSPFALINGHFGGGSGEIALELGIKGYAVTYSSGSASGNDTIGYASSMIRDDDVDVVVAGGAEAPFISTLWGIFCLTKVMTTRNDNPHGSMRPLDKTHDGFLLGEGAGFLVLEELSHALARGARIYAELASHGRSCEAYHSVSPHPEGIGMQRAMEKALRKARMHASEIDYINIHGTATGTNDHAEIHAIKSLFGGHARRVAVSATKPVTGHLLAASGAIETIICALAIKNRCIPFTLNLNDPDDGIDCNLVFGQSRPYPLRAVMNVNCGFGGKNACLILKEYS